MTYHPRPSGPPKPSGTSPGVTDHYTRPTTPEPEEPLCEGLAPFHCGNPDCPAHGEGGQS